MCIEGSIGCMISTSKANSTVSVLFFFLHSNGIFEAILFHEKHLKKPKQYCEFYKLHFLATFRAQ